MAPMQRGEGKSFSPEANERVREGLRELVRRNGDNRTRTGKLLGVSQAAVSAGEEGCSFEMPVAAAGFATHLANAVTNDGFLRDEGGLLVVFFLTDEPDKSVESDETYRDMILEAKEGCGGEACVYVGGLVPQCIEGVNQKLWQFMNQFPAAPIYGDIEDTQAYAQVFGDALAGAIAEACANVPAVG